MEDIIPILIVVAISAIGAINRSKKKKMAEEQQRLKGENTTTEEFEYGEAENEREYSWFEKQLLGIEDESQNIYEPYIDPIVDPEPAIVEVEEEVAEPLTLKNQYDELLKREGGSGIKGRNLVDYSEYGGSIADGEIGDASSMKDNQTKNVIMKDFSLDKAVVFAEIINRKYT